MAYGGEERRGSSPSYVFLLSPAMSVPNSRVLDHDADTGITEIYHFDPETHGFVIETQQDVSGLIEVNKAQANVSDGGWQGDLHHVARLPNVILMDLAQRGILTYGGRILDDRRFRAWLNDRDNQAFRVKPGRV